MLINDDQSDQIDYGRNRVHSAWSEVSQHLSHSYLKKKDIVREIVLWPTGQFLIETFHTLYTLTSSKISVSPRICRQFLARKKWGDLLIYAT